jgi:hypothetical protein
METLMAKIPREHRMIQLVLFGERLALPHWGDLAEPSRVEVVRLLAQLLVSVRTGSSSPAHQSRGQRDE